MVLHHYSRFTGYRSVISSSVVRVRTYVEYLGACYAHLFHRSRF